MGWQINYFFKREGVSVVRGIIFVLKVLQTWICVKLSSVPRLSNILTACKVMYNSLNNAGRNATVIS